MRYLSIQEKLRRQFFERVSCGDSFLWIGKSVPCLNKSFRAGKDTNETPRL